MQPKEMFRTMRGVVAALIVLAVVFGGCDDDEWLNRDLSGTGWRLVAWSASSMYPGDFTITAEFDESSISGIAAVNRYSASCSTSSDRDFTLGTMTMTKMAGSESEMRAESMYVELLLRVKKYSIAASTLTLRDKESNELLIFERQ